MYIKIDVLYKPCKKGVGVKLENGNMVGDRTVKFKFARKNKMV